MRSFALSTKKGKQVWIEPIVDVVAKTVRFEVRTGMGVAPAAPKIGRGAKFRCLVCGNTAEDQHVKDEAVAGRMHAKLMAMVAEGPRGRVYLPPDEAHVAVARSAEPAWAPEEELPYEPRAIWCTLYGLKTYRNLFTDRQLVALTTFSDLVGEAREKVLRGAEAAWPDLGAAPAADAKASAYADAVATYLAFGLSKATSRNCTLAIWEVGMDRLAGALGRQALPMTWDFAETNPLAGAGGDIAGTVASVAEVLDKLQATVPGVVDQWDATARTAALPMMISTDPPYYDNIGYADLSDFFFVWLRRSLRDVYPTLFSTLLTPKSQELIASPYRFDGSKDKAEEFFETGLKAAFLRVLEMSHPDYPTTAYYAFKQSESAGDGAVASTGWERMLSGLLDAGFAVVGTWPMRTELTGALKKDVGALASSIILVCRPRSVAAPLATRKEFIAALRDELPDALMKLQHGNIAPVDLAQASIGPGMAVYSRYSKVLEADGSQMMVRTALALINQALDEILAEQEGEFDSSTRWAIAWFEQFGIQTGEFGVAETLCKAKNCSVRGMVEDGFLETKGGKVRLLRRDELDEDWDPATDKRLTVWEMTQHLLGRLDDGEAAASTLARQLGGENAEKARNLAYRLYLVCDRKKWSQEGQAYNGLVVAWPSIMQLASSRPVAAAQPQTSMDL